MIAVFFAELIHLFSAILGVFCLAPAHSKVQVCLILIVCSWKANLQKKYFHGRTSMRNCNLCEKLVKYSLPLWWDDHIFKTLFVGWSQYFLILSHEKVQMLNHFMHLIFVNCCGEERKRVVPGADSEGAGSSHCLLPREQDQALKYAKNFILSHHFYSLMQHKIPVFNGWSTSSKSQIHVARFSNQLLEMMNSV